MLWLLFFLQLPGLGPVTLAPENIALSTTGKIIARNGQTIAVYDSENQLIFDTECPRSLQVFFIGETPAVSSFQEKGLLLFNSDQDPPQKVNKFFPRYSFDLGQGTLLALPFLAPADQDSFAIAFRSSTHAKEGILVLVSLNHPELGWVPGKKVAPLSREQKRLNLNHKAFWAIGSPSRFYLFQASHNFYDEIVEGEHLARHQMDLPGWVPPNFDRDILSGTFPKREYAAREEKAAWGHSRVLGAFPLADGFAVCYTGKDQKYVETSQVAIFDDRSILTSVSEQRGMLFGTIGNIGYFLSPRGDGQEIFTVPLN